MALRRELLRGQAGYGARGAACRSLRFGGAKSAVQRGGAGAPRALVPCDPPRAEVRGRAGRQVGGYARWRSLTGASGPRPRVVGWSVFVAFGVRLEDRFAALRCLSVGDGWSCVNTNQIRVDASFRNEIGVLVLYG